jgi:hypothetical protein
VIDIRYIRILTASILLGFMSVLLQVLPGLLGQPFTLIALLSGFPIYIISRINPRHGIAAYAAVGAAAVLIRAPEGLLFLLLYGIAGLVLGLMSRIIESKTAMCIFMAALLTLILVLFNYMLGIHIFYPSIHKLPIFQTISLFCCLLPCCYAYLAVAVHIYMAFRSSFRI